MELYALDECQRDLRRTVEKLGSEESVHIRHLGLDLGNVNEPMIMLFEQFNSKEIFLELLVITDSVNRVQPPVTRTPKIRQWCGSVKHNVEDVLDRLSDSLDETLRKEEKTLRIHVKNYTRIPAVHGFSLEQLGNPIVNYLSFNRWTKNGREIDWGYNRYRKVPGHADDDSSRDLREIFTTTFAHFWNAEPSNAHEVLIGAPVDGYEYDVFVSHNSRDASEACLLVGLLRDQNLKVWFDKDNMLPGDRTWQSLGEGLKKSRVVLALIGSDGQGPYQGHELEIFMTSLLKHPEKKVIPVVLPGCADGQELPDYLSHLICERLASEVTAENVERLVEAIRSPRAGRDYRN